MFDRTPASSEPRILSEHTPGGPDHPRPVYVPPLLDPGRAARRRRTAFPRDPRDCRQPGRGRSGCLKTAGGTEREPSPAAHRHWEGPSHDTAHLCRHRGPRHAPRRARADDSHRRLARAQGLASALRRRGGGRHGIRGRSPCEPADAVPALARLPGPRGGGTAARSRRNRWTAASPSPPPCIPPGTAARPPPASCTPATPLCCSAPIPPCLSTRWLRGARKGR